MRRRVTVWSVPSDPDGFRLLCEPPVKKVSTMDRPGDEVPGTGSVTIPADYEHLDLILEADPSDPDGHPASLIVVEQDDGDGWHPVFEFFAEDSQDAITDAGAVVVISGPEIRSAVDDGIVYPRSDDSPHYQWGAPTLTKNADLAESTIADEEISLWVDDGATGSFTIDVESSGSPATISVGDSASDVKSALEGLSTVDEVQVSGSGTEDDPWRIIFTEPGGTELFQQTNDSGLTGGSSFLRHDVSGGQSTPTYYTKAQTYEGVVYGVHGGSSMAVVDDPAGGGGKALRIVGNSAFIGTQQIIDVDPDSDGYASVEVYTTSATDEFRYVIRTIDGGFIASSGGAGGYEGITLTPDQWNTITIPTVTIDPEHGDRIILRISVVSEGNPDDFYVRNLEYHPGLPGTTAGDIADTLLSVAIARGALAWLELDFDAEQDSAGEYWDVDDLAFQADAGEKLGTHVLGDLQAAGYEADLIRIPDAELESGSGVIPTHRLQLFNPGTRGPAAGLNTAIVIGSGIVGGTVAKRRVPFTDLLVETYDGNYVEVTDARVSGLPRRERFIRAEQARDAATATKIGEAAFDAMIENLLAAQVRLSGDTTVAYRDFDIGSTVPYTLGRRAARHTRRIHTIATEFDGEKWTDTITASRLYAGIGEGRGDSPLVLEAVRKLYATFDRRRRPKAIRGGGAAVLPAAPQVEAAQSAGAYAVLSRTATQEIATGGEVIVWDELIRSSHITIDGSEFTIQRPGYYNVAIPHIQWDSFAGGGAVWIEKNGEQVWPPTASAGIWTAAAGSEFRDEGPAIPCEVGDVITVWVNPYPDESGSGSETLASATVAVYLVDRASSSPSILKAYAEILHDSDTTSHALTLPDTIASGDRIILIFHGTDLGLSAIDVTDWDGFSELTETIVEPANDNEKSWTAHKLADGSEAGEDVTITTDVAVTSAIVALVFDGTRLTGDAPEATATVGGVSNAPDPPSETHSVAAPLYAVVAAYGTDGPDAASPSAGRSTVAYPSGYDPIQTIGSSIGSTDGATIGSAWRLTAAATEDPPAFTFDQDSDQWSATTIMIPVVS